MKIIYTDGHVDECPQDQELHVIRHTAAHVMAQAIKRLYPDVYKRQVEDPVDAYTFAHVNDGNAVAMPFAKGFGWGGELNLAITTTRPYTF